jgi:hypothetical protein
MVLVFLRGRDVATGMMPLGRFFIASFPYQNYLAIWPQFQQTV